jgi:hypothetical protein
LVRVREYCARAREVGISALHSGITAHPVRREIMAGRTIVARTLGSVGLRGWVAGAASILAAVQLLAGTATSQTLRASDGTVACLVSRAPDGPQGQSQLAVQVRAPRSPAAEVAASLPLELRDFSSLPVRVVLLSQSTRVARAQRNDCRSH